MRLLREYIRRTLTEIVGDQCDVLAVFDFDDTLVTSDSAIGVTHKDGTSERLTSAAYALYRPRPGDEFDYSEFNSVMSPVSTKYLEVLRDTLDKCGTDSVLVLTARSSESKSALQEFFSDVGVYLVDIVTVGGPGATGASSAKAKALVIRDYVRRLHPRGISVVHFYDDSSANIHAVRVMADQDPVFMGPDGVPVVEVITHHVDIGH